MIGEVEILVAEWLDNEYINKVMGRVDAEAGGDVADGDAVGDPKITAKMSTYSKPR
jgi:hypothetical protein